MPVRGILFDKDGTLFDFGATWNGWAKGILTELGQDHPDRTAAMAEALHFDLAAGAFRPTSPVIAGTNAEVAALLLPSLPDWQGARLEGFLSERAARAALVPAAPLVPLLEGLRGQGLRLGVMTNDTEFSARAQLSGAGVLELFDFIAGHDSGHGAKPAPDPLLAFARAMSLPPETVVMVGDSTHDLEAGRAAGMRTLGVLTGMAGPADLAPLADAVLDDIGHLPGWLAA
nr:HAD family hydrolase [Pseudooceanicola endophyticus]